jgi:hypothetical protein
MAAHHSPIVQGSITETIANRPVESRAAAIGIDLRWLNCTRSGWRHEDWKLDAVTRAASAPRRRSAALPRMDDVLSGGALQVIADVRRSHRIGDI